MRAISAELDADDERVELRLDLLDRHAVVQLADDGLERFLARGGDLGVDRLGGGAGGLLGDDLVARDLGADVVEDLRRRGRRPSGRRTRPWRRAPSSRRAPGS